MYVILLLLSVVGLALFYAKATYRAGNKLR